MLAPKATKQLGLVFLLVGVIMTAMLFMAWHGAKNESMRKVGTMGANVFQLSFGSISLDEKYTKRAIDEMEENDVDDDEIDERRETLAEDTDEENEEMNDAIGMRPWYLLAIVGPAAMVVLGVVMFMGMSPMMALMSKVAVGALVLSMLLSFMARGVNYGKDMAKAQLDEMYDDMDKGDIKDFKKEGKDDEMIEAMKCGYASTSADLGFGGMVTLLLSAMALPLALITMMNAPAAPVAAAAAPSAPASPEAPAAPAVPEEVPSESNDA